MRSVPCDEIAIEYAARAKYARRRKGSAPGWDDLAEETREQWRSGIRKVVRDLDEAGRCESHVAEICHA